MLFKLGNLGKGSARVVLGAVVMVPDSRDLQVTAMQGARSHAQEASGNARPLYSSRTPILGNDVLQSWMERIRKLGLQSLWLASAPRDENSRWSLAEFARRGIERLLVIKLKSYAEMDLADLLQVHCESRNPVTEAQDAGGPLGVHLIDHSALHETGDSCTTTDGPRTLYQFRGYAKRILSARERQDLIGDALTGACAMRPIGTQIREQVWIAEGVNLANSVRIIGPAYIGARTIVRAGATIGPFASVERDCVVDCGTTVQRSTILPSTYLGPGLLIRHALVDGGYLEHLDWGTVADLQSAGLGSRIHRREAHRETFARGRTSTGVFSRPGNASAGDFAPSSRTSQPWVQVQL